MMKILAVADVFARAGRDTIINYLPDIIREYGVDMVIANGENAAHGRGINPNCAEEMFGSGVDVITTGNHVWDNRSVFDLLEQNANVIVPANLIQKHGNKGYVIYEKNGIRVGVINLIGKVYTNIDADCPFKTADKILETIRNDVDITVVDFHAEATSEKVAMGWYLDGRVSAVYGTHTHIQTADESILNKGTGYITDVGMTGPVYSVLGMERDVVINRFLGKNSGRFEPADGCCQINAALFDIEPKTGKTQSVVRIFRKMPRGVQRH